MKYLYFLIVISLFFISCSSKSQLFYIDDYSKKDNLKRVNNLSLANKIEIGDILKIDVQTFVPEASISYNVSKSSLNTSQNLDLIRLEGYLVDENFMTPKSVKSIQNFVFEASKLCFLIATLILLGTCLA